MNLNTNTWLLQVLWLKGKQISYLSFLVTIVIYLSCRKGKFITKITEHCCKRQAREPWSRVAVTMDRTSINLLPKEIVMQNIGNCCNHQSYIFQWNCHPFKVVYWLQSWKGQEKEKISCKNSTTSKVILHFFCICLSCSFSNNDFGQYYY